ncbi:hypothetical protein CBL_04460 [Carabus blaptoides fortunei]
MQLFLVTLWLIAATVAAPTTESNQPSTTAQQKTIARQLPIDNFGYMIVTPLETRHQPELALDESSGGETIDNQVIVDGQNGGEMMHTAEHMVFRPLFSYRKLQEKRRRQNGSKRPATNSPNTLRRSAYVYSRPYYPYGYYYPY